MRQGLRPINSSSTAVLRIAPQEPVALRRLVTAGVCRDLRVPVAYDGGREIVELLRLDLADSVLGVLAPLERLLDRSAAGAVADVVTSLA
jgi:hypothetical protein